MGRGVLGQLAEMLLNYGSEQTLWLPSIDVVVEAETYNTNKDTPCLFVLPNMDSKDLVPYDRRGVAGTSERDAVASINHLIKVLLMMRVFKR